MMENDVHYIESMDTHNVSCDHIIAYKNEELLSSYELLHAVYVACIIKDSWKRKKEDYKCMVELCKTVRRRIHACLFCVYFGCFEQHIHIHARTEQHPLAIDMDLGHIFCFECNDYQYDADFERISRKHHLIAVHKRGMSTGITYKWLPSLEEVNLIKKHDYINVSDIGIRGLINMDSFTCYLSVIIQSLIHAPAFRDYLFSLKHKCEFQSSIDEEDSFPDCFICELSKIAQEFFSGKTEGYALHRLLHLVWIKVPALATCEQQDAHECFLALLDKLHLNCEGSSSDSCKCIIHNIFGVILYHDRTCNGCKNVGTMVDSQWDISVTLKSSVGDDPVQSISQSFDDCLKSSLHDEIHEYRCHKCMKVGICSEKIFLKKLPLVLSFYLKQPRDTKNTEFFIHYKEFLDVSAYMLPSSSGKNEDNSFNNLKYRFYLFAVVEYKPSGNNASKQAEKQYGKGGHYICYIRQHKQKWFSCDDHKIKSVKIEDVLKIKACILFYHRQF